MRQKGPGETVRRAITFPKAFAERMENLKTQKHYQSDSELIREAIKLMELLSSADGEVIFRDRESGEERVVMAP